jgi:hypothetical protein
MAIGIHKTHLTPISFPGPRFSPLRAGDPPHQARARSTQDVPAQGGHYRLGSTLAPPHQVTDPCSDVLLHKYLSSQSRSHRYKRIL